MACLWWVSDAVNDVPDQSGFLFTSFLSGVQQLSQLMFIFANVKVPVRNVSSPVATSYSQSSSSYLPSLTNFVLLRYAFRFFLVRSSSSNDRQASSSIRQLTAYFQGINVMARNCDEHDGITALLCESEKWKTRPALRSAEDCSSIGLAIHWHLG